MSSQKTPDLQPLAAHVIETHSSEILSSRLRRHGPEAQLLTNFLQNTTMRTPPGSSLTVLREPRIGCTYPDILLLIWDKVVVERFSCATRLTQKDLTILHFLKFATRARTDDLRSRFGRDVKASLDRLLARGLIMTDTRWWRLTKDDPSFALMHLIAIEAKVKKIALAARQAFYNTSFASESYVLLQNANWVSLEMETWTWGGTAVYNSATSPPWRKFSVRLSPRKC